MTESSRSLTTAGSNPFLTALPSKMLPEGWRDHAPNAVVP